MDKRINYLLGLVSGLALAVILWVAIVPLFSQNVPAGSSSSAAVRRSNPHAPSPELEDALARLNHIHQIINTHYIGDFDVDLAIEMMLAGFVYAAGDPYTVYKTQQEFTAFREHNNAAFVGIGINITTDPYDNRIKVITPFEGSPAINAGILPGDKIIRVDGHEVFGGSGTNEAISMMRGREGTEVVVTILRESENTTFDVTIVRETIRIETVRHNVIDGTNTGYIRITQFSQNTYPAFEAAFNSLMAQGVDSLIIDVRNNGGGSLDAVSSIADMLVPEGIITFTEDANGRRTYTRSDARQIEVPLVMLVNGNSASASELLAGAVRDRGVGEILGTTTFGKGLVQSIFPLAEGTALKVTIARYFTPDGICINGEGIVPNHYVEMPVELTNNLTMLSQEDDVQLQAALELLRDMKSGTN